ncbi:hypothetical protein [Cellulosimicrobium sp. NPDC057127]|uniref:hypothetical protein n=1 Tax=Cellulosimicrobium sp. NPDC057127 TaxID=3346026 RepID=UPI00363FE65C
MAEGLSQDEQDTIVGELIEGIETLDEDESDALYDQLDADHQMRVDAAVRRFADNAVGDEHWDSDN